MANACPNIGVLFALLATAGILYTIASKYWKQNSPVSSANFVNGLQSYEGLWVRCISPEAGRFNCDSFDVSFLGLPQFLQIVRALMCLSAIFAAGGIVAGLLGLDCVSAMGNSKWKIWTGRIGGILLLLAGLLCVVSVSWYAADVIYNFTLSEHSNNEFVYEFGSALYVGWVASFFALLSGSILLCCNCASNEEDEASRYVYRPSMNKPTGRSPEYV